MSRASNSTNSDAFIRQFASEIAQALRAQDETPRQSSLEESVPVLYRALCFDEPIIDENEIPNLSVVASALVRQLLSTSSPLAISNRLVNGIVYLSKQRSLPQDSTSKGKTSTSSSTPSQAVSLAKLAFCVLIQVPLECLQDFDNRDRVRQCLGSYHGTTAPIPPQIIPGSNPSEEETQERVERLAEALSSASIGAQNEKEDTKNSPPDNEETSSLQEVWAAESDPSDYDYGEGDTSDPMPSTALPSGPEEDYEDWLDPTVLSRPPPVTSTAEDEREAQRQAIGSLLQQASYTLFAPIFASTTIGTSTSKSATNLLERSVDELTQLLLLLLKPPQSVLLQSEETYEVTPSKAALQDAILAPLWILRDAALHTASTSSRASSSPSTMSLYLDVLQTLLAVDQAFEKDRKPHLTGKNPEGLCSASIVGLSALSSWCSTANISIPLTTTAVLDAMNDLAHVVERASSPSSGGTGNGGGYQTNVRHAVIPILEILTGVTYNLCTPGFKASPMIAQTVLNSGFLRQVLLLSLLPTAEASAAAAAAAISTVESTPSDAGDSNIPYYPQLNHAVWGLCVVYPKVIGKYVARYPGVPSFVRYCGGRGRSGSSTTSPSVTSRDCVDSILWNCFGCFQCDDVSQQPQPAPRVVWKTKKATAATAPPLTKEECMEVGQKAWVQLCQTVREVVLQAHMAPHTALEVLQDLERLLVLVSGTPSVRPIFQSLTTDDGSSQLQSIRTALDQVLLEMREDHHDLRNQDGKLQVTKPQEEEEEEDGKKASLSNPELVVATTRKLLKQYTLFFQGDGRASSKTD